MDELTANRTAYEFDEWVDNLPYEKQEVVNDHLKSLSVIKNLGTISAKVLLSQVYLFVGGKDV